MHMSKVGIEDVMFCSVVSKKIDIKYAYQITINSI